MSAQLGHASIQITADLCGHLFKETSRQAMRRLNRAVPALDENPATTAANRRAPAGRRCLEVVAGAA